MKTKNKVAPNVCSIRKGHPLVMFRETIITCSNVDIKFVENCIEIMIPVIICSLKHIAKIDPIFHRYEMFDGVGSLMRFFLISFIFWVFIFYNDCWVLGIFD